MTREAAAHEGVRWRTSSYTSGGQDAECVEIGVPPVGGHLLIRDTKHRHGGRLTFPARSFVSFIESQKSPNQR
jgi:hypothetical protein